ncbi:MAG: hypothetical protein IJO26_00655 [Clostridium sp.]|nr:hypothetical protein [Clostridium sp.]
MGNNRDDIRTNKKKFLTKEERIKIKRTIEKKKKNNIIYFSNFLNFNNIWCFLLLLFLKWIEN